MLAACHPAVNLIRDSNKQKWARWWNRRKEVESVRFFFFVCVLTQIFSLHSSFYIAKAPALLRRSTKSVCRLHRVKACPYSNTTCYPEPKDSPPPCSVLRAQVAYRTHKFIQFTLSFFLFFALTQIFCLFSCLTVTAVYDVTLNFKDNQTPTLLSIVNGKKYKADMCVRWVSLTAVLYLWTSSCCDNDALHSTEFF